jgi:hypothetical protein
MTKPEPLTDGSLAPDGDAADNGSPSAPPAPPTAEPLHVTAFGPGRPGRRATWRFFVQTSSAGHPSVRLVEPTGD